MSFQRAVRLFPLLGLLLCLGGCDPSAALKKITPEKDEAFARRYVDLLRDYKFAEVEKDLDLSIKPPEVGDTLKRMADLFPAGEEPMSAKVVGVTAFHGNGEERCEIALEYEFSDTWILAVVDTRKKDGIFSVMSFNVNPMKDSLEHANRFTLTGKPAEAYVLLLLMIASIGFSLYAFALCVRTKIEKRKWIWCVLTLVGVGRLGINWTTGAGFFNVFWLQLPPGGASSTFYSPWMVFASLPLGAILFMVWRKGLSAPATNAGSTVSA